MVRLCVAVLLLAILSGCVYVARRDSVRKQITDARDYTYRTMLLDSRDDRYLNGVQTQVNEQLKRLDDMEVVSVSITYKPPEENSGDRFGTGYALITYKVPKALDKKAAK